MSMKTYANGGWVIPREVLEKEFPKELEFLNENEETSLEEGPKHCTECDWKE